MAALFIALALVSIIGVGTFGVFLWFTMEYVGANHSEACNDLMGSLKDSCD